MTSWLKQLKRIEGIDQEIASLRAGLAEMAASAARADQRAAAAEARLEAFEDLDQRVARLSDEMARYAGRAQSIAVALASLNERAASVEKRLAAVDASVSGVLEQSGADGGGPSRLDASLLRLEKRLQLHMEESDKTATALLERVELARIAAARSTPAG